MTSTSPAQPLALPIAYLNGEFVPVEEARISPLDRGFIFGDGIYEVIPIYDGRALRMREHLLRMQRSMDFLELRNPYPFDHWEEIISELVSKNGGGDVSIYIQVTRGVAKRDFSPPQGLAPTVFMMANKLPTPSRELYENGISCISLDDFRWGRCHVKSTSLLGAVLLKHEANQHHVDDCVLFRDGYLTESSSSNVCAIREGVILCPPKDNLILPGITYDLMIELARRAGIPLEMRRVSRREVGIADELWLTSSTKEVIAITRLDGRPVGNGEHAGKPGPLFWKMFALFQDYKRSLSAVESTAKAAE
jgi:D-alanine transaminase